MIKHAIVTGAASGIGSDCCKDLLNRGWTVHGLDISNKGLSDLENFAKSISQIFHSYVCDVSKSSDVKHVLDKITSSVDVIDALVCSAGIFRAGPLVDMQEKDFDDLFAINTKGAWLSIKATMPLLKNAAARKRSPRVVVVASVAAIRPKVGGGAYAASKVAITQIVKVMAVEMANEGILINAIAPATVDTPLTQALTANATTNQYRVSGSSPLGRVGMPADVTSVIRFLLSDDASYITGTVIPIDGGTSAAFRPI